MNAADRALTGPRFSDYVTVVKCLYWLPVTFQFNFTIITLCIFLATVTVGPYKYYQKKKKYFLPKDLKVLYQSVRLILLSVFYRGWHWGSKALSRLTFFSEKYPSVANNVQCITISDTSWGSSRVDMVLENANIFNIVLCRPALRRVRWQGALKDKGYLESCLYYASHCCCGQRRCTIFSKDGSVFSFICSFKRLLWFNLKD